MGIRRTAEVLHASRLSGCIVTDIAAQTGRRSPNIHFCRLCYNKLCAGDVDGACVQLEQSRIILATFHNQRLAHQTHSTPPGTAKSLLVVMAHTGGAEQPPVTIQLLLRQLACWCRYRTVHTGDVRDANPVLA